MTGDDLFEGPLTVRLPGCSVERLIAVAASMARVDGYSVADIRAAVRRVAECDEVWRGLELMQGPLEEAAAEVETALTVERVGGGRASSGGRS